MRARVIYASTERVPENAITYEDLADPKWRGRICTRSGQHEYNIALTASMIAHHGEDAAREWLAAVKQNLARKPAGNDREQVKSIYAGECDISVGNTYYMALMRTNDKEPEQKDWAAAVKIIMPNVEDRGTHVNLSGMVLAKNAPHRDNAVKLMEWLTSAEAQRIYAEVNHEYPLREGVPISDMVASFGALHADSLGLAEIARHRARASELVDEVGYNDGPSS
jgi:iron(III) transport system substrate-binding protein